MCFSKFTISYIQGKKLLLADALSMAPILEAVEEDLFLQQETTAYVNTVVQSMTATERQLEQIRHHLEEDEECRQVFEYCQFGWPSRQSLVGVMKHYHTVRSETSVQDGLLIRGNRVVILSALRLEMLDQIHTGHQGISKCCE